MPYTYMAVTATTGEIIDPLPQFSCDSVSRQLGDYTQTTGSLPLPLAPATWRQATLPGAVNIVLIHVDATTAVETPIWGATLLKRPRTQDDSFQCSLVTYEANFDRRFVGDQEYDQVAPEQVMADLAARYLVAGIGPNVGFPLRVAVLQSTGLLVDRTYQASDNTSVYKAFQELSAIAGGPEWTVTWEKSLDGTAFTPVLWIGARIGKPTTPGLSPDVTFTLGGTGGNLSGFEYDEDYSSTNGGNVVNATDSATGDSIQLVTFDPLRPTYEVAISPTIDDNDSLQAHAQAEAEAVVNGVNTLTLSSRIATGNRVGVDWDAGDDIGYQIGGLVDEAESVPAFPGGIEGVVRAIGWSFSPDTRDQSPILEDPEAP